MARELFKRRANRFCVWFRGYGPVPVASSLDDKPEFLSSPPRRIGDDCLIFVEGKKRLARLLMSDMTHPSPFLVDMGPHPSRRG